MFYACKLSIFYKDSEKRVENKTSSLVFYPEPHPIFEVNLEYILWGGKPHSFGELKLTSSQTTLISRCHCEKYSSRLDISCSFVIIFAVNRENRLHSQ